MADIRRTVEVKVVAEYWATIELEDDEIKLSKDDIEKMAWEEFYDNAHRAEIISHDIEQDLTTCWDCETDDVDSDHECPEESDEE